MPNRWIAPTSPAPISASGTYEQTTPTLLRDLDSWSPAVISYHGVGAPPVPTLDQLMADRPPTLQEQIMWEIEPGSVENPWERPVVWGVRRRPMMEARAYDDPTWLKRQGGNTPGADPRWQWANNNLIFPWHFGRLERDYDGYYG